MDIIAFNEASTANSRIEICNANPDSTSGIVTVPKTIASGETITIPSGRVAVLPNVQVDGVLNVENGGEVFIPSGATLSSVVEKVTSTDNAIVRFDGTTGAVQDSSILIDDNGNLNINGTGKRITGNFSNATEANRCMFQTNILNGSTLVSVLPNGTGTVSGFGSYNNSDANNSSLGYISTNSSAVRLISAISGTGSFLPLAFYTTNAERMRIDTAGNVLAVSPTGGLGYGTGAGGTVTQLTSKSTAVTLNKPTGYINMISGELAAGASVTFTFNNSLLSTADTLNITIYSGSIATQGSYRLTWSIKASLAYITLTNQSALALNESPLLNFAIIKGANS